MANSIITETVTNVSEFKDNTMDKVTSGPRQPVAELIRDEHAFKRFPKEHQEIILDRLDDMELDAIAGMREGQTIYKVNIDEL